jgi:hypothetical protein
MVSMDASMPRQAQPSITWPAQMVPLQGADQGVDIVITHMSSRVLTANSHAPVAPGLPVRLDRGDSMLLGEVVACREESSGQYALMIEMNESLAGLHSLRNLVSTLLGSMREGDARHPFESDPLEQMLHKPEPRRKGRQPEDQRQAS